MTYFIGADCIDVMDRSCVEECPVDCIYEGETKLYINPAECIDCGYCQHVCPVAAVGNDREGDGGSGHLADNRLFFAEILPGREAPVGNPGGSLKSGVIGVDTPQIAKLLKAQAS
jgi:NAD-dependent dihydropyrimidine dehydrogenase PreA subunit